VEDSPQYVEVLVNKNVGGLYKTYQYKVADSIQKEITIGSRVIVPFGSILVDGFVLQLEKKAKIDNIKEVISVVDSDLALDEEIISIAKWMSEQYLCPLALCLRCFLPLGSISKVKKYVSVAKNVSTEEMDNEDREIIEYVRGKGKVLLSSLQRKFNSSQNAIRNLKSKGILQENTELESGTKEKKIKKVYLAVDNETAEKMITTRAVKQKKIVSILRQNNGIPLKNLIDKANCDYSTVKALQNKKIVAVKEENDQGSHEPVKVERKKLLPQQKSILNTLTEALLAETASRFLLHGVTGSGKTEIYVRLVEKAISFGKQAIVLVPEITLTLNLVKQLHGEFGDSVAVLHSGITASEKYNYWRKIKNGECKVVVGARSAVFAPCKNLGLIVIDEEHEWTYKQDVNPKYHTREVAWKRIQMKKGVLLLGSATPSLETYWRTRGTDLKLLHMKNRVHNRPLPYVEVVDMREEIRNGNYNIFSRYLIESLHHTIQKNESAMLLVTRRGFASFILCKSCGFVMECPNCQVTLTVHKDKGVLQCHYCQHKRRIPDKCPQCGSVNWKPYGVGTQRVEEELTKRFGDKVIRVDSDSTSKKGATEELLGEFEKKGGIMVGTQMIAKGLHFSNVTLVGVIDADSVLKLPDFRARERNFQLLTQVAGRAGRGKKKGKVVIQTYNPSDLSILTAQNHDYLSFYNEEIKQRKTFNYPPFVHLVQCTLIHGNEITVGKAALKLKELVKENISGYENVVMILGPAPASVAKIKNKYRWQLILKSKNLKFARKVMARSLHNFYEDFGTSVKVEVDVNPVGMV